MSTVQTYYFAKMFMVYHTTNSITDNKTAKGPLA